MGHRGRRVLAAVRAALVLGAGAGRLFERHPGGLAAPWLLEGAGAGATAGSVIVGIALVLPSLPRGEVRYRYAGWDRYIV